MSERKVLNVSTGRTIALLPHVSAYLSVRFDITSLSLVSLLEILSAGFRSVEDPAHETGEKSPVHRAIDGAVQHAVQDVR